MATAHPLADVVQRRAQALMRRFHADPLPPLTAAAGLADKLAVHAYGGGTLEPLPGAQAPGVQIWRARNPDDSALWAPRAYIDYRDACFRFLDHVYGPVDRAGAGSCQVDHLFNKSCAPDHFLLRVEAIPAWVNQIHGATYERLDSASAIQDARRAPARDHRKMTVVSVLKLAGLAPPRARNDRSRLDAAIGHFTVRGWPGTEAAQALDALLQVAALRRAQLSHRLRRR